MVQRSPFLTQSVAVSRSRAVVPAGDDHIPDTGLVPVGQAHFRCGRGVVQAIGAGASVEVRDEVPGGGEHDRVEPSRPVGNPSREGILGGGGEVADMDAPVVEIEAPAPRVAVAEGERCCRFGGVGEAMQLGQAEGAVCVFDVA